jgi:hypothetical protein
MYHIKLQVKIKAKNFQEIVSREFCISVNRVVKWHGTNGTILRRLKSKSDSYLGVEET